MSKPTTKARVMSFLETDEGMYMNEGASVPTGLGVKEFLELLQNVVSKQFDDDTGRDWAWIEEVYDDYLVFRKGEKFYKASYQVEMNDDNSEEGVTITVSQNTEEVQRQVKYEGATMKRKKITEGGKDGAIFKEANFDDNSMIVKNVTLMGAESLNGYTYSESAMKEAATLLEGAPQYLNHPFTEAEAEARDVTKLFATVNGVRYIASESKIRGDMHLVDTPTVRDEILPRMKHFSNKIGNSIVAYAEMEEGGDRPAIVGHILSIESCDLVTDPATNTGLFESVTNKSKNPNTGGGQDMKFTVQDVRDNPEIFEAIRAEIIEGIEDAKAQEALKKENEFLKKENLELKTKVEESELEKAITAKKELIAELIAESKVLSEHKKVAVTESWVASLEKNCNDKVDIQEAIKEREALVTSFTQKKLQHEHVVDVREHRDSFKVTDEDLIAINESAFK